MTFQKAVKTQARARITFDGPAGSGKTYSSLVLAKALGGRCALIDTEHGSASKYADLFDFDQVSPDEFSLDTYLKLIKEARGYDVLVIDSLSHAWMGKGGAMEEVDRVGGREKFTSGWRTVTPKHNELIDSILAFPGHVICTMRKKMEYVLDTEVRNGKSVQVPRKVGMAPVQREGMEYEFDVVIDLDVEGNLHVAKTRCSALQAKRNQLRHADVPELGAMLKAWLTDGAPVVVKAPPPSPAQLSDATRIEADKVKQWHEAFVAVGVDVAALAAKLGHPADVLTRADLPVLKAFLAEKKNPDEAARLAVQKQAEEALPKFETYVDRIRAAATEAEVVLIQAEAVGKVTSGDLKALKRAGEDRIFLLREAAKPAPVPTQADVPF